MIQGEWYDSTFNFRKQYIVQSVRNLTSGFPSGDEDNFTQTFIFNTKKRTLNFILKNFFPQKDTVISWGRVSVLVVILD